MKHMKYEYAHEIRIQRVEQTRVEDRNTLIRSMAFWVFSMRSLIRNLDQFG